MYQEDLSLKKINLFLLFLIIILLPFSPYLSYFLCLLLLILFSLSSNKNFLFFVFILGCWSQLFVLNSRIYIVELEYDLSIYYSSYLEKLNWNWFDIIKNHYPEVSWYLLYKFIGLLNSELEVYDIAIINTLICEIGFSMWLYLHGSKGISKQYLGLFLGISLLFLWPNNFSFFQRQSLSVIFLLFAISNIDKFYRFVFYLLIASSFHITSLLMGIIYFIIQKNKLKQFVIVLIVIVFSLRFLFDFIIIYLTSFIDIASVVKKANFYSNNTGGFFAISELRFMPLFVFIFIFYKKIDNKWKNIVLFTSLFYISLLGIQFASGRMNFILFYCYGLFLYMSLKNQPQILISYSLSYFIFDFLYKSGLVFSINDNFWQRYDIISFTPFYYIK